jgi:methionine-rich copper-binding protein CopC
VEVFMGGRGTRAAAPLVATIAGALGALLPAAPASAHNSLTGSDPRDGARLAVAPTQVQLTFLSPLDPHTATITVTGPDNVSAEAGSSTFNGAKVAVPFRPGAAGLYHIGYQVHLR